MGPQVTIPMTPQPLPRPQSNLWTLHPSEHLWLLHTPSLVTHPLKGRAEKIRPGLSQKLLRGTGDVASGKCARRGNDLRMSYGPLAWPVSIPGKAQWSQLSQVSPERYIYM